jgi:hypothetical protein
MMKLKLTSVQDDKPVKLTVALPAALHRDLVAYAEILAGESGQTIKPAKLIAPMLEKFIAGNRGFAKARGSARRRASNSASSPSLAPPSSNAPD